MIKMSTKIIPSLYFSLQHLVVSTRWYKLIIDKISMCLYSGKVLNHNKSLVFSIVLCFFQYFFHFLVLISSLVALSYLLYHPILTHSVCCNILFKNKHRNQIFPPYWELWFTWTLTAINSHDLNPVLCPSTLYFLWDFAQGVQWDRKQV